MIRLTENYGYVDIPIEEEIIFPTINGMKTIIPYSQKWKTVIVQTSGGLDSTLLLYLISKVFLEKNSSTKIQPLCLEVPTKAKNLTSSRSVVSKIKELTKSQNILPEIEVKMPLEMCHPPNKDKFFREIVREIMTDNNCDFEFNGNTKNPPESVRVHFPKDKYRQASRDNRKSIYNTDWSASPHALNDKSGIINLYLKEGIFECLTPLTLSCDMDLAEITKRQLPIPCKQCWWCHERIWGFKANDVHE